MRNNSKKILPVNFEYIVPVLILFRVLVV